MNINSQKTGKWDKKKELLLTYTEVRRLFAYNAGILYWKMRRPPFGFKGQIAGWTSKKGYHSISINGVKYPRAKLVWLYHKKVWPKEELDHKNRIRNDDRIENLRPANRFDNATNRFRNGKPPKGVYPNNGGFYACLQANGKNYRLGQFSTEEEAMKAHRKASLKYQKEFSPFKGHKPQQ